MAVRDLRYFFFFENTTTENLWSMYSTNDVLTLLRGKRLYNKYYEVLNIEEQHSTARAQPS